MTDPSDFPPPDIWLEQILSTGPARTGGVIKRQVRDVERIVGRAHFYKALERRGFQAVENGRHFVIFCNQMPIKRIR